MLRTQSRLFCRGEVRTGYFCQPFSQEFFVLGKTVVAHTVFDINFSGIILASISGAIHHDDNTVKLIINSLVTHRRENLAYAKKRTFIYTPKLMQSRKILPRTLQKERKGHSEIRKLRDGL